MNFRIKAATTGPKHHFFGYYDTCPWDKSNNLLLALETDFVDHLSSSDEDVIIGIVKKDYNKFNPISKTSAWNWQQGCMLQWLPPEYENKIIFNDRRGGKFISVILDILTCEENVLPMPIYSIHPSGEWAITLNFSRLDFVRHGYGYGGIDDPVSREKISKKEGIFLLNLKTGEHKLIISLEDLYNFNYLDLMEYGVHWIDHLTFSPNGERFAFFHRFELENGRFYTRLFTANKDGSGLFLLLDSGMASHFCWQDNNKILSWGRKPTMAAGVEKRKNIMKFLLPIYRKLKIGNSFLRRKLIGDGYLLFTDKTGVFHSIGKNLLEDGHPSFCPLDKNLIITDTYPDKNHYRKLILYDINKDKRIDIGKFYSLPDKNYTTDPNWDLSNLRCDLHPRWNRNGTQICFDSVHEGNRQIYILDIKK